jgi:rhamnogalacturonyl hydrolase YesR
LINFLKKIVQHLDYCFFKSIIDTPKGYLSLHRQFLLFYNPLSSRRIYFLSRLIEVHMIRKVLRSGYKLFKFNKLSKAAQKEHLKDIFGHLAEDSGYEKAIEYGAAWLSLAQDSSLSHDGGVARNYSLLNGWSASYPETTGYIVPTLLDYAKLSGDGRMRTRAKKMLDWLVSIQFPDGGFQCGVINSKVKVPVTFNTGQILIGLAKGVSEFGDEYFKPMQKAAEWLVKTQDADGCWRKHPTPLAASGEKTYETHVAWGLLEAARITSNNKYADAALANVRWALTYQKDNGWFDKCCLTNPAQPLTHTLGYAFRGIVEAFRFTQDAKLLQSCTKAADGLLSAIQDDGFLPGRLDSLWKGSVSWTCLTGSAQIALCLFIMYELTSDVRYLEAACAANRYVRRTMNMRGPLETVGAVKGSYPVYGDYCAYEYPNWACKFFVDTNMFERHIQGK